MPESLKELINHLSTPELFITISVVLLAACLVFYRQVTRPGAAISVLALTVAFLALSLGDENFRKIVTKPDNVAITMMLLAVGFFCWVAFRQAALNDARMLRGEKPREALEKDEVPVWPELMYIELITAILCMVVLMVWSILLDAPLEEPANPTVSPNPAKAPWYFLGLQELLLYFDSWIAGVLLPTVIILGLMAIPYIDRNPKGNGYYTFRQRPFAISLFLFGFIILWVTPIIIGTFLRGPNWNLFGPYEPWDVNKLDPQVNINLSDIVWIRLLGMGLPRELAGSNLLGILLREVPGILLVGAYLGVLPVMLARTLFKKKYQEIGIARYAVMSILFLLMFSVPIKMLLRWIFVIKYIVAIPEYSFNI